MRARLPHPPGPFRPTFWQSPLRSRWFTSVLGVVLLVGLPVLIITGLLSYAAYNPDLGGRDNERTPDKGILGFYLFDWPTDPAWLYQLTQGIHVILGLALVPVLLAKLWSVIPRLFAWPPVRSPAQALERLGIVLLVGGGLFEFATGIMNIQYWYVFPGSFYPLHFYGGWIFVAGLILHVTVKLPVALSALRHGRRGGRDEPDELRAPSPAPATISRRGALGLIGGSSLLILAVSAGQAIGGPLRRIALLAPRGGFSEGPGPQDFPVNKGVAAADIAPEQLGPAWRVELRGRLQVRLGRADLLALPQHTERLPIACVEGWSTTQDWTGVRLRDLAELAGTPNPGVLQVESVQQRGSFRSARLRRNQVLDERSLLALSVNGAPLSPDHGYPARIIVPGNPGVHNTKWVSSLTFER